MGVVPRAGRAGSPAGHGTQLCIHSPRAAREPLGENMTSRSRLCFAGDLSAQLPHFLPPGPPPCRAPSPQSQAVYAAKAEVSGAGDGQSELPVGPGCPALDWNPGWGGSSPGPVSLSDWCFLREGACCSVGVRPGERCAQTVPCPGGIQRLAHRPRLLAQRLTGVSPTARGSPTPQRPSPSPGEVH